MLCGSAEAEERTYRKIIGKSGAVWLVPTCANPAQWVHYHNPKDTRSDGYGGRTLTFSLEDGTVYHARGPWHTNADSLFKDTGLDIRNTHLTFVVLSKAVDHDEQYNRIMVDVVHIDEKPTEGSFDRYKELARLHPEAKFYYSEWHGGSSSGTLP